MPLDVTDAESVGRASPPPEEHAGGALACVVSNAGYAVLGAIEDMDLGEVRAMFETNLFGRRGGAPAGPARRCARRAAGVVVFVSSIGARISNPLLGLYHASKYGLSALAEALAVEWRPFGIRVATIEPGMVDTDFPRAHPPDRRGRRGRARTPRSSAELRAGFGRWRRDHPTTGRRGRRRSWPPPSTRTAPSACRSATTRAC